MSLRQSSEHSLITTDLLLLSIYFLVSIQSIKVLVDTHVVACILFPRTLYRRSIILWHNEFVSFTCSQDAFVSWKWNFDWFDSMTNNISASDLFSSILKRDIPDSTLKPFASIACWFFFVFILRKIPLLTLSLMLHTQHFQLYAVKAQLFLRCLLFRWWSVFSCSFVVDVIGQKSGG